MSEEEKLNLILKRFEIFEENQNKQAIRQQRMERALIGDKDFDQKGIVQDVSEIKAYIDKDKTEKARQKGIVIGLGAASGGLMAWIKSLWG